MAPWPGLVSPLRCCAVRVPEQSAKPSIRDSRKGRGKGRGKGGVAAVKSLPDIEMSRASDVNITAGLDITAGPVSPGDAPPLLLAEATADVSSVTTAAERAEALLESAKEHQEAYEEAMVELKAEKKQNRRLRARLQKMEQSVRTAESKAKACEEKAEQTTARETQLEQKIHSQDLLLKAKEREREEVAAESRAGEITLSKQTVNASKLRVDLDEDGFAAMAEPDTAEMVAPLRRELEDLKQELGRRAIMIGKMEGQVAKSDAKAKAADTRIRLAEGRLKEAANTLSIVRGDNAQEEAAVASLKQQLASASLKVREQQETIDFILRNLEQTELQVAEVTVEAQIAREKRKRAEKKLRILRETQASNNLPLQAIGESAGEVEDVNGAEEVEARLAEALESAEAAEAEVEAKDRLIKKLMKEKREWCVLMWAAALRPAPPCAALLPCPASGMHRAYADAYAYGMCYAYYARREEEKLAFRMKLEAELHAAQEARERVATVRSNSAMSSPASHRSSPSPSPDSP
eukprot:COSAG06_NODE_916_length_11564_cov_7.148190_11_plen_521_part_00